MEDDFGNTNLSVTSPLVLAYPELEIPFVIETDASSVAIDVVFVKYKEDGNVHLIKY